MYQEKIDILMAELYTGNPCSQRYYLRRTLMFLSQHPEYLGRHRNESLQGHA